MTTHLPRAAAFLGVLVVTLFVPAATLADQSGAVETTRIFEALGLKEGMTVCEMGAGDGALSIAAARRVGSQGQVYTNELGDDRVKALRAKVAGASMAHVSVVAGNENRTNFPDGACDALFMRNVYHHFADPAAMNVSIAAAMKPGARLAIVDFAPPPNSEAACPADRGKDGMHGITSETLSRELNAAGFQPVASEDGAQRWFMVVVSKPLK